MKRIAFVVALTAALLISTAALAAIRTYNGNVSTGTITFRAKKSNHKTVLEKLLFRTVPIKCNSGNGTVSGQDQLDSLPVTNNTFRVVLNATDPKFNAKLVFAGKITGADAKGTFHLSGKKVPLDDQSIGKNCDTKVLDWKASTN
jgi:hypothetical protein